MSDDVGHRLEREPGEDEDVFVDTDTEPNRLEPTPYVWTAPSAIPRREWLYGHHLIRRYVSLTVAPGGVGKSSLLMAEALAMVTGRELLGEHPAKPLRVWYWNGEDDQDENRRRMAALCSHYHVSADQIGDRLFMDTGREKEILLATSDASGFRLNPDFGLLEDEMKANAIDVLMLDPFVASHNVGENDNMAINGVIRGLARVAERSTSAIELAHHVRKPGGGVVADTDVNDARGASALIGGVRSARVLNVMGKPEAERLEIDNRFAYFRVDNAKANLAPRTEQATWRHIISIDLENGGELPSDRVGVIVKWELPGIFSDIGDTVIPAVQAAVKGGSYRYDAQAKDWLGFFVGDLCKIDPTERDGKARITKMIDEWVKSDVLAKQMRADESRRQRMFLIVGETRIQPRSAPKDDDELF